MAASSFVSAPQQHPSSGGPEHRSVRSGPRIRRDRLESPAFEANPDDDAEPDQAPMRPARQVRRREWPWLRIGVASVAVIAALAYVAQKEELESLEPSGSPVPHANLVAPPPPWQSVAQPASAYAVEDADGKAMPVMLDVRRHVAGGREDTLTFGVFGEPGYARLSITRGPAEPESGRFFVELVRRAASAGLAVARSGQSEAVATKFGMVEAASITLADAAEQPCLAFRFAHAETSFGFQGWLCGSDTLPISTGHVACFLDRLALVAVDDQPLKVVFAQSDRRRLEACAPALRTAAARRS